MKVDITTQSYPVIPASDTKSGYLYRLNGNFYLAVSPCLAISEPVRKANPFHSFFVNLGKNKSSFPPNLAILRGDVLMEEIGEAKVSLMGYGA